MLIISELNAQVERIARENELSRIKGPVQFQSGSEL